MKWKEAKPQPKVAGGVLAGAITVILVWVLSLFGVEVPGAVGAALATVVGAISAWLVPEGSQ
ncbi:unnamed protein product [marine sediment metagenome]|uniref:Holin n=1 Tax=marine sediment metagenome TaxID=412755 RepID=X0YIP9_9ZZZZ